MNKISAKHTFVISIFVATLFLGGDILFAFSARPKSKKDVPAKTVSSKENYQEYLDFFDKIYETMQANYYLVVDPQDYERFIKVFEKEIYSKLKNSGKSVDYVRWRSAAYLIEFLKSEEDIFSAFFPPAPAKKFEQKVLGKKVDLGIEGQLTDDGFLISHIEPRSDAYEKGLRANDIVKMIQDEDVLFLSEKEIQTLLRPLAGTLTSIVYFNVRMQEEKQVEVKTKEYFKQTVFMKPTRVPNIYLLELRKFNRKTSEDMLTYLKYIAQNSENSSIILDIRGNPGGPPLAAREISAFFLTPDDDFAYFQKRNKPKSLLTVPNIPERFHYKGPIVILVNEGSGSASELFSGAMQYRGRAVILGKNTAGKVLLKSMFPFEDESMVLLVTGRGYYPDGTVYSFDGVKPDKVFEDASEDELVNHALNYLLHLQQ